VSEEAVLQFLRAQVGSVYALEVLLFLKQRKRVWMPDEIVRELRSSRTAVSNALDRLVLAGLAAETPGRGFAFVPADEELSALAEEIEKVYATKPMMVVKSIMTEPNEKLRVFSDAFKLKS
jgi:DNA-binding transcriptional regulator GbsR (MarR family)